MLLSQLALPPFISISLSLALLFFSSQLCVITITNNESRRANVTLSFGRPRSSGCTDPLFTCNTKTPRAVERWCTHIIERFPEDLVTRPPALRQRRGAEREKEKTKKWKQVGGCSCCDPLSSIHQTHAQHFPCLRGRKKHPPSLLFNPIQTKGNRHRNGGPVEARAERKRESFCISLGPDENKSVSATHQTVVLFLAGSEFVSSLRYVVHTTIEKLWSERMSRPCQLIRTSRATCLPSSLVIFQYYFSPSLSLSLPPFVLNIPVLLNLFPSLSSIPSTLSLALDQFPMGRWIVIISDYSVILCSYGGTIFFARERRNRAIGQVEGKRDI